MSDDLEHENAKLRRLVAFLLKQLAIALSAADSQPSTTSIEDNS